MEGVRGDGDESGDDRAAREKEREKVMGEMELLRERLSHMQDECTQVRARQSAGVNIIILFC